MSKQVELSAGGVLMDDDGRKLTVAALAPTGGTTGDVPTVQANGTIALATPSATSGTGLPSTVVSKTTTYTAAGGEYVQADATGGAFTVTLPTNPAAGTLVAVKKTDSTANTVTIAAAGGGTIDGSATATTTTQFAGAIFEHIGSNVWAVAASMSTTGPQGPTGATGATGATGPSGPTGPNSGGLLPRGFLSGKYVPLNPGTAQNVTLSRGYIYLFPFEVFASTSFTEIVVSVVTGQTSSVGRLGVYADSSGAPGALLWEATATTQQDWSTAGQKTTTITRTLAAGVYWCAVRAEGGSADPVLYGTQAMPVVISSSTIAGAVQNACGGYNDGGSGSGALTTLGALSQATIMPRVAMKTA